jgi:hypothetical protein
VIHWQTFVWKVALYVHFAVPQHGAVQRLTAGEQHAPFWQLCGAGHVTTVAPQAPLVSQPCTLEPEHRREPGVHTPVQAPPEQT